MDQQAQVAELQAALVAKDAQIVAKDTRILDLEQQVEILRQQVLDLTKQVAALTQRLGQNSRNSHLPPSSDPPGSRGTGGRKDGPRKRGGQPGHPGRRRELLPESQVDDVVDFYPAKCGNCWHPLPRIPDPAPCRHQTTEVPPIKPHTTVSARA